MIPAEDGLIRDGAAHYPWRSNALPSFAAAIAGSAADRRFAIDYGIRPDSLTRLAFVDVARGDARALAGKCQRGRSTDPTPCTRDDDDAILQIHAASGSSMPCAANHSAAMCSFAILRG